MEISVVISVCFDLQNLFFLNNPTNSKELKFPELQIYFLIFQQNLRFVQLSASISERPMAER